MRKPSSSTASLSVGSLGSVVFVDATKEGGKYVIHGCNDDLERSQSGAQGRRKVGKDLAIGAALDAGALALAANQLVRGGKRWLRCKPSPDGKTVIEEEVKVNEIKSTKYYGPDGEVYAVTQQEVRADGIVEETVILNGKPVKRPTWLVWSTLRRRAASTSFMVSGTLSKRLRMRRRRSSRMPKPLAKEAAIAGALTAGALDFGRPRRWYVPPEVQPQWQDSREERVTVEDVKVDEIKSAKYYGPDGEVHAVTQEEVKEEDIVEETINSKLVKRLTWLGRIVDATQQGGKYIVHGARDAVTVTDNGLKVLAKDAEAVAKSYPCYCPWSWSYRVWYQGLVSPQAEPGLQKRDRRKGEV